MTFIRTKAAIAALSLAGALAFAGTAAADGQDGGGDRHGGRATTVHCGQTLTQSVRLANDLTNCPADGLVIGADGITVDLNGHTIDGTVAQPTDCENAPREPAGIKNGGGDSRVYDRLTIENGKLQQFAQGFNAGSDTDGMADSRLHDLTVRDNSSGGLDMGSGGLFTNRNRVRHNLITGTRCGNGIVVNSSDGSLVAENTVRDNLGGILLCCSVRNVVRDNLVAHNADAGIAVCCDGRDNLIEHNKVFDNASLGILVFFGTEGTLVRENHVARNGDNIILESSARTRLRTTWSPTRSGARSATPRPGSASRSSTTPTTTSSPATSSPGQRRTGSGSSTSIRTTPTTRSRTGPWCAATSCATPGWMACTSTRGPRTPCSSATARSAAVTMASRSTAPRRC